MLKKLREYFRPQTRVRVVDSLWADGEQNTTYYAEYRWVLEDRQWAVISASGYVDWRTSGVDSLDEAKARIKKFWENQESDAIKHRKTTCIKYPD